MPSRAINTVVAALWALALPNSVFALPENRQQIVLTVDDPIHPSPPPHGLLADHVALAGPNWSIKEQGDSVCKADASQFTGHINVTDNKSLFFWFVESKEDPEHRPVVIWLNGGPAASSMPGLFTEVGPCYIDKSLNGTVSTEASWSDFANLLIIDQPAGVGFSTVDKLENAPHNLNMSSTDLVNMLGIFYGDIFPRLLSNPLYIAGESFGGRYAPALARAIQLHQIERSAGPLQSLQLRGVILVNAMVGVGYGAMGQYELFCTDTPPNVVRFNETACRDMASNLPECERLSKLCISTSQSSVCFDAIERCMRIENYYQEEIDAGRHSLYDLRRDCPDPPLCGVGVDERHGNVNEFLNLPGVQAKLGFDPPIEYKWLNMELNMMWSMDPNMAIPTTNELTYLLNGGTKNPTGSVDPESVVAVLIINGEYDAGANLPGMLRQYDDLPWHDHAAYRAQQHMKPWFYPYIDGSRREGGKWKGAGISSRRGLEFISVYDAGHMAPMDQRVAVAAAVGRWLKGNASLGGLLDV